DSWTGFKISYSQVHENFHLQPNPRPFHSSPWLKNFFGSWMIFVRLGLRKGISQSGMGLGNRLSEFQWGGGTGGYVLSLVGRRSIREKKKSDLMSGGRTFALKLIERHRNRPECRRCRGKKSRFPARKRRRR